jgi:hypothetical protein
MEIQTRRAFVISPIGAEGTPTRDHADDVFEFIISPALQELGIEALRADQLAMPGRLSEQMISAILGESFCIAILTGANPNVYYELAIAHAAARPVVVLIEKGQALPFDVKDIRSIEYDLKPRSIRDGEFAKQIVAQVRQIEHRSWSGEVPFGENLMPLGAARPEARIVSEQRALGGAEYWKSILDGTNTRFLACGISLAFLTEIDGVRDLFAGVAKRGARISLMNLTAENETVRNHLGDPASSKDVVALRDSIRKATKRISRDLSFREVSFRRLAFSHLGFSLVANEHTAVLTPYLSGRYATRSPAYVAEARSELYKIWIEEFESLWKLASGSSADSQT